MSDNNTEKKVDLYELLKQGKVEEFNRYREENPSERVDLNGADLTRANLNEADLRGANLSGSGDTRRRASDLEAGTNDLETEADELGARDDDSMRAGDPKPSPILRVWLDRTWTNRLSESK